MNLEEQLESVAVMAPGQWENDAGPKGWFAVADESGIVAYFGTERAAFFFRLALINARLNPIFPPALTPGTQPSPLVRELIASAAKAAEHFSEDELEEFAAQHNARNRSEIGL
jgi:hypothetical protein